MSQNRYAKRRDANEHQLVALAEQIGAFWYAAPPLDGWICFRGKWLGPVEIKRPEREGHKNEFTEAQIIFRARAKLIGAPYLIWRTEVDVYDCLGARRSA